MPARPKKRSRAYHPNFHTPRAAPSASHFLPPGRRSACTDPDVSIPYIGENPLQAFWQLKDPLPVAPAQPTISYRLAHVPGSNPLGSVRAVPVAELFAPTSLLGKSAFCLCFSSFIA